MDPSVEGACNYMDTLRVTFLNFGDMGIEILIQHFHNIGCLLDYNWSETVDRDVIRKCLLDEIVMEARELIGTYKRVFDSETEPDALLEVFKNIRHNLMILKAYGTEENDVI